MENNNLPQDTVVISRQEYEMLRQSGSIAPPQPQYVSASSFSSRDINRDKKMSTTQIILALLAIGVILSVIIPVGTIFFIPITIFGVLAVKGFFKTDSSKSPEAQAGSLLFKIVAAICITIGTLVGLFVIFMIIIFGLFTAGGQSS